MATTFLPEMAIPLPRPNAVQWGTHIRRCNRKRRRSGCDCSLGCGSDSRVGDLLTVVIAQPRSYPAYSTEPLPIHKVDPAFWSVTGVTKRRFWRNTTVSEV